jgi:hypothetical protein
MLCRWTFKPTSKICASLKSAPLVAGPLGSRVSGNSGRPAGRCPAANCSDALPRALPGAFKQPWKTLPKAQIRAIAPIGPLVWLTEARISDREAAQRCCLGFGHNAVLPGRSPAHAAVSAPGLTVYHPSWPDDILRLACDEVHHATAAFNI